MKNLDDLLLVCNYLDDYNVSNLKKLNNKEIEYLFAKNIDNINVDLAGSCKLSDKHFNICIKIISEKMAYALCHNKTLTQKQINILFSTYFLLKGHYCEWLSDIKTLEKDQINKLLNKNQEYINNNLSWHCTTLTEEHIDRLFNSNDKDVISGLLSNKSISKKIKDKLIQQIIKREVFK